MANKFVKNICKRHHDSSKEKTIYTKKLKSCEQDVNDDRYSTLKLNVKNQNNYEDLESSFGWYYCTSESSKNITINRKLEESSFLEAKGPEENRNKENTEVRHMSSKYAAELFLETASLQNYKFVDCRYPYEYEGGHIRGAINFYTPFQAMTQLFLNGDSGIWLNEESVTNVGSKNSVESLVTAPFVECSNGDDKTKTSSGDAIISDHDRPGSDKNMMVTQGLLCDAVERVLNDDRVRLSSKSMALIFYCEFSSARAPAIANCVRNMDRLANLSRYPSLFVPNIWVLRGGYHEFHSAFEEYCEPNGYVSMTTDNVSDVDNDRSDKDSRERKVEDRRRKDCAKYDKEVRLQNAMWSKVYTSRFHHKVQS